LTGGPLFGPPTMAEPSSFAPLGASTGDRSAAAQALDRLAASLSASRWVVCWRDANEWLAYSADPQGRDEILARLAPELVSKTRMVAPAEVGDPGRRLDAAGVTLLLTVTPGEDGGVVLFLENPDRAAATSWTSGATSEVTGQLVLILRRLLETERWSRELFLLRRWFGALARMGEYEEESVALEALGGLTGHDAVIGLVPMLGASSVIAAWVEGDGWRHGSMSMPVSVWDEAWERPEEGLSRAASELGMPLRHWRVGRAADVDRPVVLGLAGRGPAPSPEALGMFASTLARTLIRRRAAAAGRHSALLEERTRIASVIHEGITQVMTNVAIQLEVLDQVLDDDPEEARSRVRASREAVLEALDALRGAIFELTPTSMEWTDLADGMRSYVADFGSQWGLEVDLRISGPPREADADVTALAFAFVQEGLTNVRKHAGVSVAEVAVAFGENELQISVCDRGKGFDPSSPDRHAYRRHQGLALTRSRVRMVGGRFAVRAAPGEGTCLLMAVPLRARPAERSGPTFGEESLAGEGES
jgi:signal transduction histidine kinase